MAAAIDYMNPDLPHGLDVVTMPVVIATEDTLRGYGCLVDDPNGFQLEIVKWPAAGWRPIDDGTGDEAGTKVGIFESEWKGDFLFGRNKSRGYFRLQAGTCTQARHSDAWCRWLGNLPGRAG